MTKSTFLKRRLHLLLETNYRGKDHAIKRKDLLQWARFVDPDVTDRQLRIIYASLPVVSSEAGIYWPMTTEELMEFRAYLRKKAIPILSRWRRVADAHPEISAQLPLFESEDVVQKAEGQSV